jgi:hypothetical protein
MGRCCSGGTQGDQWWDVHWVYLNMNGAKKPMKVLSLETEELGKPWELPPHLFKRPNQLCDEALDDENKKWIQFANHPCNFTQV